MNNKTIWITGGSTGIGKAVAIKFANEGWNVAISARRENLLKEISNNNDNIYAIDIITWRQKARKVIVFFTDNTINHAFDGSRDDIITPAGNDNKYIALFVNIRDSIRIETVNGNRIWKNNS